MDALNYMLACLTAFAGLGCGMALSYIAKEELKDGKDHFILMENILISMMIFFLIVGYSLNIIIGGISALAAFIVLRFWLNSRKRQMIRYFDYFFMGILFYFSIVNLNIFLLQAALIFIYGFPAGSLLIFRMKKKNIPEIILKNISFMIIAAALYILI